MIKCEVVQRFTLERFNELKNIQRIGVDTYGELYVGDIFECEKELADYLTGNNSKNACVVKVIEIIPEEPKISIVSMSPVGNFKVDNSGITTTASYKKDIPTTKGIETKTTYKPITKKSTKKISKK